MIRDVNHRWPGAIRAFRISEPVREIQPDEGDTDG